ncbi:uncharacterized protein MKZ38_007204 [Zalerion maritima]|uniref:Uncharacterized protein n=1 Tax=Zalerion maritima TaxID=339359 RepID=A0AAD5RI12_9PEZI|nr:uncharacterized protein MKZ38_007204 [Zalerion maritima]
MSLVSIAWPLGRKYLLVLLFTLLVLLYLLPAHQLLPELPAEPSIEIQQQISTNSSNQEKPPVEQPRNDTKAENLGPSIRPPSRIEAGDTLLPGSAIVSPSGRFTFVLTEDGDLIYSDLATQKQTSISDTRLKWPVTYTATLSSKTGELELRWYYTPAGASSEHGFPWSSSFLSGCAPAEDNDRMWGSHHTSPLSSSPALEITDSGLLHIHADDKTHCVLHPPISSSGANGDQKHGGKRMALVYSGFLLTFVQTCSEHRARLVDAWREAGDGNEVDVHIYSYLEDVPPFVNPKTGKEHAPRKDEIERKLRLCFGSALKTVELVSYREVEEKWTGAGMELLGFCPIERLERHLNQFKGTYGIGKQLRRYMITQGVSYDYILKTRPDLTFWGALPLAEAPALTPENGILSARLGMDWAWYSLLHDANLRSGVSDLLAFGRPTPMFAFMDLYREFKWLRETEKAKEVKFKAMNTHHHETTGINDAEHCTPENILAYWLHLSGVEVVTGWDWNMSILRGHEDVKFSCPVEGRFWNCPGGVP